ncbi:MAG: PAS domain S-box protein [Candidatus Bathyarchaeia archaeon]
MQKSEQDSRVIIDAADLESSSNKSAIRVLHVDDDPCCLEISKQILMDMGNFEIDSVSCVDEAFKKIAIGHYDVVISDYEVPLKNGLDFLSELREQNNQISFILFTGKGREDVAVKALNLGADRYINKNGSPETVFCELTDAINKTVERKKSREILRESEQRYRELANCLPDIVFETDLKGQVIFVNEKTPEISGYSREELESGLNILQFLVPGDRERATKSIQRLLSGGKYVPDEYTVLRKDGTTFPALITATSRISQNKMAGLRGLVLDITERKKTEEVVRKSEAKYRELANFLPEMVFEADLTGKITFISQRASEVAGFTREELEKGLNLLSFIVPEERERAMENMKKSLAGAEHGANEYTLLRKNGTTYPAIVRTNLIISENKVTGLRGLALDITDRKKTEEALLLSEEKFRTAFATAPDAFYISTLKEDKLIEVNECYEEMFGYTRQEAIGKTSQQLGIWANPSDREKMFALLKSEGEVRNLEINCIRKNGQIFPAQFSISILQGNKQQLLVGVIRDVSSYKQAEEALRESEEKYRTLVEKSTQGILIAQGPIPHIVFANSTMSKILGYNVQELTSLSPQQTIGLVHPDDQNLFFGRFKERLEGKPVPSKYMVQGIRKDGAIVWMELSSALIEYSGQPAVQAMFQDITEHKKAEERRKVLERKVNEYSEHLKCMVDLRTSQLKDVNERLMKTERLAAIGELSGMVGHDLRNPLASIKNATYFLKKKGTTISETQHKEMLEIIDKAIDHSDKIINDLLEYSREMHLELTESTLPTLLEAAMRMIHVPDRIQILNHVHEEIAIRVDADKIMRIFLNLIKNAIDATPEKGTLKISSCKTKDYVKIAFADTGTGIPKETLPKIFMPLFTTKAQGMGFGLAICKRIVEAHCGTITVKTAVNKGTTFTISLPIKPKVPLPKNQAVLENQNANRKQNAPLFFTFA